MLGSAPSPINRAGLILHTTDFHLAWSNSQSSIRSIGDFDILSLPYIYRSAWSNVSVPRTAIRILATKELLGTTYDPGASSRDSWDEMNRGYCRPVCQVLLAGNTEKPGSFDIFPLS
jgi:hypothetical protein